MNTIKMYEILKKTNLSDEDAHAFVDEVISAVNQRFDDKKELLATKVDIANAKSDLSREISGVYRQLLLWIVGTGIGSVLLKTLIEYLQA